MLRYFQKIMKVVLPLLFGVGIFWFLMSKVDLEQVNEVIDKGISWTWVAISLFIGLLSHIVRGLRWRLQIRTLGVNPSVHDMSVSVFGNYGLNLIFPRLGEIWRCNYIANTYGTSFTTTLGTMISERIVDMTMSVMIALVAFLFESHVFFQLIGDNGRFGGGIVDLVCSPRFYVAIVILAVILLICKKIFAENRLYKYVMGLFKNVWTGILSLKELPNKWSYLFYSLLLWGLYYLNSYTGLFFFDFTSHLGPTQALLVFIMGSLSLVVPVQGGLGAWHAMVILTLGFYGIGTTEAFSFAMVHWLIQEGFVLLLGLYALVVVAFRKDKSVNP